MEISLNKLFYSQSTLFRIISQILFKFQPNLQVILLDFDSSCLLLCSFTFVFTGSELWKGFSPWLGVLVWIRPKQQPFHRLLLHVGPLPVPGENPNRWSFFLWPLQSVWSILTVAAFPPSHAVSINHTSQNFTSIYHSTPESPQRKPVSRRLKPAVTCKIFKSSDNTCLEALTVHHNCYFLLYHTLFLVIGFI